MTLTSYLNNFNSMELIIGDDITLDKDHNYYYKGELITGAISTTQFMSQQWPELFKFDPKYIPEDKLLEARVVGNTIHKLIELGMYKAPSYIINDNNDRKRELRFWNTKYNVVGSIDELELYFEIKEIWIEDYKVTSAKYLSKKKTYANYQTIIYMLCIMPFIKSISKNINITRALGFIAKDKDFKYDEYKLDDNKELIKEIESRLQERINE